MSFPKNLPSTNAPVLLQVYQFRFLKHVKGSYAHAFQEAKMLPSVKCETCKARPWSKIQIETAALFVKFEIDDRETGAGRFKSNIPVSVSLAREIAIQDAPATMEAPEFRLDLFRKDRCDVILVPARETSRRAPRP